MISRQIIVLGMSRNNTKDILGILSKLGSTMVVLLGYGDPVSFRFIPRLTAQPQPSEHCVSFWSGWHDSA